MDEFALQKASQELNELRDQLRALRTEIAALEEKEMRGGGEAVAAELTNLRRKLGGMRAHHDELANFVEGDLDAPTGGPIAGLANFVADYKWPIVGVLAMAVIVGVMFLVSQPQVSEEERARAKAAMAGIAKEQVESTVDAAAEAQHRMMRDAERAMGGAPRPGGR
jgi:hypothetical protein